MNLFVPTLKFPRTTTSSTQLEMGQALMQIANALGTYMIRKTAQGLFRGAVNSLVQVFRLGNNRHNGGNDDALT